MKRSFNIIILSLVLVSSLSGQETLYGPGYQMMLMNNPALSGAENEGVLRLSYLNFYPGNHYNLHSIYSSYDSYFPVLHGGAGIWISDDYLGGIVNDLRGGLSYAYYLRAGEDLYVNAGLSASVYHRGFNFSNAVLPDQIDPVGGVILPAGESLTARGKTVFDIGTGFLFIYRSFFGGFSLSHLSKPDLSEGMATEKLKRKLIAHATADISLNRGRNIKLRPMAYIEIQGDRMAAAAGTVFGLNALDLNVLFQADNAKNVNIQTGFSVKSGRFSIFYNYRFNVFSGNTLVPLSLLHQTGLAFSLNRVDKRNDFKTISLPKM